MGYNNLCVGMDVAPASFVALPFLSLCSYLSLRFVFLDTQRVELEKERLTQSQYLLTWRSNMLYGLVQLFLPGIPLISPEKNVEAHTAIFFCVIISRALVVLANFYEARDVTRSQEVFMLYYVVVSLLLPALIAVDLYQYDSTGTVPQEPAVPVMLLMPLDMSWFICLALTTHFLPHAPPIIVTYALGESTEGAPPAVSPSRVQQTAAGSRKGYLRLQTREEREAAPGGQTTPVGATTESPGRRHRSPAKPAVSPASSTGVLQEGTALRKSPRGHSSYYSRAGGVEGGAV